MTVCIGSQIIFENPERKREERETAVINPSFMLTLHHIMQTFKDPGQEAC